MSSPSYTVFEKIYQRKWAFLGVFTLVYFLTLVGLSAFGLTPWSGSISTNGTQIDNGRSVALSRGEGEVPLRIEIPSIGIRTTVSSPKNADIPTLDAALLSGAVRYPGSALPGEEGNVLMFGHSSHLPVVQNQAFKAFNDIQNLEERDPVFVIGEKKVYVYAVQKVEEANTATDAIALDVSGAQLTLATCNNFGTKEDRFIVTARLVKIEDRVEAAE